MRTSCCMRIRISPLNAKVEGVMKETVDWTEVKVSFDAAYDGERMAAYLFLPKHVQPPYQTVLFFPSARVMALPPDSSELGDVKFFNYILQSGRAVMYPVYEDTYERRTRNSRPGGGQDVNLTVGLVQGRSAIAGLPGDAEGHRQQQAGVPGGEHGVGGRCDPIDATAGPFEDPRSCSMEGFSCRRRRRVATRRSLQ